GVDRARLRGPAAARSDHRGLGRERRLHFFALHLAERRFGLLREAQGARPALAPLDDRVDVHESRAQPFRHEPAHRGFAGPRQADQHDVPLHDAAPFGVRARTCARYPSKFRLVSLSASPPNFSSSACASTRAIIASAMTPMAATAVTSDRSDCAWAGPPVFRSTVRSGAISVEIGFIATRATRGSPVLMPPSVPPARFVARAKPGRISSCTSEPLRRAASKPRPTSTPFTAGLDIRACARRPSSFLSPAACEPSTAGLASPPPSTVTPTPPPAGDPRDGLAGAGALQDVAGVAAVVLERPGQVGVARAGPGDLAAPLAAGGVGLGSHDVLPVLPVAVPDEHGDGGAERFPGAHAGEPFDAVGLDLHAGATAVAALAPLQLRVHALGGHGKAGGDPLEDRHQAARVRA